SPASNGVRSMLLKTSRSSTNGLLRRQQFRQSLSCNGDSLRRSWRHNPVQTINQKRKKVLPLKLIADDRQKADMINNKPFNQIGSFDPPLTEKIPNLH
ncbi:MAG: hypothetical protein ACK58T_37480, partial [Phycisphaerae bacterium]